MPIYWDKKNKAWRFTFNRIVTVNGSRHRKRATKLLPKGWSRTQAEEYERQATPELYAVATGVRKPQYLIDKAVLHFCEDKCPHLRIGKKIIRELAKMSRYYTGKSVEDLAEVASAYKKDHTDLAPGTIKVRLAYLRSACRYAHGEYRWKCPKPELTTPIVRNERQVYLKIAAQNALWDALRPIEVKAIFTLSYFVGARWRSEIAPRKAVDVIRDGKDVWLDCGITKSGKPKWKWVPPQARWTLKYIPFEMSISYYYEKWAQALKELGIENLTPHDQRHSLASKIINEGGSLPDVAAALGHESLQAAARYSHLYPDHVKAVMKKHGKG